jgi:4'-phosphopantetheinyl transferase EntD
VIEELLPAEVISVDTRGDLVDATLFPDEERIVGNAVEKRRREFTTARACARAALAQLGFPPIAIPAGERGEPLWPEGVVGSITHCAGYRACAVARSTEIATLGIDAEPNIALPDGLLAEITGLDELLALRRLQLAAPEVQCGRLLFSAKESVYKAWLSVARCSLSFKDAVLTFDLSTGTFTARLLVAGPQLPGGTHGRFSGRWMVRSGIIMTAITAPASVPRSPS